MFAGAGVGGLAGQSAGTISNMTVTGSVSTAQSYYYVGGVVGNNTGTISQVSTSSNNGNSQQSLSVNGGGTASWVGGLAGLNGGAGTIASSSVDQGSTVASTSTSSSTYVGGLVGENDGSISQSNGQAAITSSAPTLGGIAGKNAGNIMAGSASGTVTYTGTGGGQSAVGGGIGLNSASGTVTGSITSGLVVGGAASNIGGYVGIQAGTILAGGAVTTVTSTGNMFGTTFEGGFAGSMTGGSITAAYAQSPVSTTATTNVVLGGFIGSAAGGTFITQAYATGYINAPVGNTIGAFIGSDGTGGLITSSFWDINTTGIADLTKGAGNTASDTGITGETTTALQAALPGSFNATINLGMGPTPVWGIVAGQSYPYFAPAYQGGAPQVISGYVYNSFANQTALPGVTLGTAINGNSNGEVATSGANGYYVLLVGPNNNNGMSSPTIPASNGNILLTLTNGGSGNTLIYGATGSVTATSDVAGSGATVFGGGWLRVAPASVGVAATNYSTIQSDLVSALGYNNPGGLLYSLNYSGMSPTFNAFNAGTRLDLEFPNTTANKLVIDTPLIDSGSAVVLNSTNDPGAGSTRGQVSQTARISAGGLVLKGIGASFGITNTSNSFSQIAISDASTSPNAVGSAGIYDTVNLSIATTAGISGANTSILVLDDPGHTVSQAANNFLTVSSLSLLGAGASYQLTGVSNLVGSLAANTDNGMTPAGSVVLADSSSLLITTVTTGSNIAPNGITSVSGVTSGTVGLELNGAFTVSQDTMNGSAITASSLFLNQLSGTSGGTFSLTNTGNAVTNLAANTDIGGLAGGSVSLADSVALNIGSVTAGPITVTGVNTQSLTIVDSASVSENIGIGITADSLAVTGTSIAFNQSNSVGTIAMLASGASGPISFNGGVGTTNIGTVGSLSGLSAGGLISLNTTGAFNQSAPIGPASMGGTAPELLLTGSGGTFNLTNTTNVVGQLVGNTNNGMVAAGTISLADSVALNISSLVVGMATFNGVVTNTLNIIDPVGVTESNAAIVSAANLLLEGAGGSVNLNQLNNIGTVAANTGAVGIVEAPGLNLNVGSEVDPISHMAVNGITTTLGVGLQADSMSFAFGINAPGQPVLLETTTSGAAVSVGSGMGGLIIPANLQITAGTLVIGGDGGKAVPSSISEGPISVNAPINFTNVTNLALVSTGTVTQTAGSTITTSGLVVEGSNITLNENNSAQNIAMLATAMNGNISFTDVANAVSITSIGAPGVLTASGLTASGSITLTATGRVTQTTPISGLGGVLPSLALLGTGGSFQLTNSSNTVASLAGNTLRINLSVTPIGTLMLGSAGMTNGLTASTLTINDTGMVGESLAINVNNLELLGAGGQYSLNNSANMIGTLAANTGSINLSDAGTLSIGAAGTTINVNATGIVSLNTDHLVFAGGTISTSGTGVFLSTLTNGTPITLGTGGTGLDLTASNLNSINANSLVIGGFQSGDITINQAIAPIHVSSLGLQTAGNVTQTAGSTISVASLGVNANNIALQEANVVSTLAMQANLAASFSDIINLTIGTVTAPASLTGARAFGGALEIATTGSLTLAGAVTGTLPAMGGGGGGGGGAMGLGGGGIGGGGGGFGTAANAVILATGADFTNNFGFNAITATNGRFLVFMGAPANNKGSSLSANPLYNQSFNFSNDTFAPITNTGNRFVYSLAPFLTVTAGPDSKIYNGTSQTSTFYGISGLLPGDNIDQAYSGQAAISGSGTHVGSYGLTASLGTLTSDFGYQFQFAPGTLTITPLPVNLTGAKVYDGTTNVASTVLSVSNQVMGDMVTVAVGSGTLSGKDAGAQTITGFGNLALGGASANDYTLMGATSAVTVNPRAVTLTGARTYDGTTSAASAILSISNVVGGDTVTLASGSATLASQHAGAQAITSVGSLMLTGATANDYTLTGATGSVTINPLAVALTGTRTYDGTTNADFSILSVTNAVNGDTVNLAAGTGTLAAATVGNEAITSPGTLALGNNSFGDYTLSGATGSVAVTKMGIIATTLSGTRVYDGMTDAPAAILTITNIIPGNDVSLTGTGVLASKNVGVEALTLTKGALTGLSLTGAVAGNYSRLAGSGSVTVTAAPLTVIAQAEVNRLYDGTTASKGMPTYQGMIYGGDTPAFTQTYASKNVGNGILLTPGGVVNDGNGGKNYSYTYMAGNVGAISPLPIALSGGRTYDGTNTISSANLYITNLQVGDSPSTVSLTPATLTLATKNAVGSDNITSLGALGITGTGASNYTLAGAFGSVTITQATLNLQAVTDSRVYDGTTNSSLTPTATGLVMTDTVTGLTQSFTSKDASFAANGSFITVNNGYTINDGNGGNNYSVNVLPAFGTITPLPVTVTGSRTYDGTTGASAGILSISNDLDGLNVALSGTGTLVSKNAGPEALVSVGGALAGLTLTGTAAFDYTLVGGSGSVNVAQAALTVQPSSAFKIYDGTTTSSQAPLVTGSVFAGDTRQFTEAYASKNAGNSLTMIVTGIVNDGNGGKNYSYNFLSGGFIDKVGTINPLTVTLGGTRTYDGTASVTAGALTITNKVMGDDINISAGSVTLLSKNVGSEGISALNGLMFSGTDAGNYMLPFGAAGSVTITQAPITVTAAVNTKTYDGTTAATATPTVTSGMLFGGDNGSFTESYASANAGTGLTLTPTGTVADGNGGNNYAITFAPIMTGVINARPIMVTGMRVYDGTTNIDSSILTITNDIDGANLTLTGSSTLSSQHVGVQSINSAGTLALGGSAKNNYTFMGASSAVTITPLAVTLSGTRTYDGTATAASTILAVANKVGGDTVTVASGSATLAGKNVGPEAITNPGTLALGNNSFGDYTLTGGSGSVNISAATLTAGLTGTVTKTYDATTAATLAAGNYTLTGIIGGDAVTLNNPTSGSFDTKNVGTGKTVSVTGLALSGAGAGNYSLASNSTSAAIGTINAATLTYAANAASQSYGTATNSFTGTVTGFVGGETVQTAATGTATFASKTSATTDIGSYAITGSGLTANSGNYIFVQAAGNATALTITPVTLTAGLTGTATKTYDATTAATLAAANYTLTPTVNGDVITLNNPTSGTFDTKNVGTGKTVGVTGLKISGTKAGDYVLASTSTSGAVGTITAATLTASLTGTVTKTYDATTAATLAANNYTLTGIIGGDAVTLNNPTSGSFDTKNVGTGKTVSVTGLALSGAGAGNYSLASNSTSAAIGTINAATLTYAANAASQSYGTATNSFTGTVTGFVGGETVQTATTGTAAFASATSATTDIGSYAITGSGLTANSGNYVFAQAAGNATALTITPVTLTAGLTGTVTKTYDATTAATLAAGNYTLTSAVNGDVITLNNPTSGTFDTKNVGTGKTVSVTGLTISGTKAGDYVLASTSTSGAVGTITAATLTAGLTGTVTKTYDGTTTATLAAANYGLSGVVGGDAVTLSNPTSGSYDTKNVGTGKTVSVAGLTLGGAGAGNYVLASGSITGAVGAINPAVLTAGLTGTVSKTYDGTVNASLAAGNYTLSGVITGDSVALNNPTSGAFNNANAGSGKAVSVTGLAISGPGSTNYTLFSGSASANIGVISPKSVTYSVANASSTFGIAPILGAATLTGVLAADTVTGTVGLFNGPLAVAANATTPVGFFTEQVVSLTGAASGNYAIAATGNTTGTLTVNAAAVTPGQIVDPNVTPPISQTISQASQQLNTVGSTSFVVSNGTAVTATLAPPATPGGNQVLSVTTTVNNVPVTYTLPVAAPAGGGGGGGGEILGAYSSFDDLLAAAQGNKQASN